MRAGLVLQYDDRKKIPFLALRKQNRAYASKHGYNYHLEKHDKHLPPYWMKPYLCLKYSTKYKYILWLDSDAVVHDSSITLPELFPANKSVVFSQNKPEFMAPNPPSLWNSGVFAIKSCTDSREILLEWLRHYPRDLWRKAKGVWTCRKNSYKCPWAGIDYEEGAFVHYILKNPKYKPFLYCYPHYFMQGHMPVHPKCFVLHFASTFKTQIPSYLSTVSKNY